jgi:hypothetical protein
MAGKRKSELETTVGLGSVALVASIFGNLKQFSDKEGHLKRDSAQLATWMRALQRMVRDLQAAKQGLKAQLDLALRTNEDQNRLISVLREQVQKAEARAFEAERRALEAAKAKSSEGRA